MFVKHGISVIKLGLNISQVMQIHKSKLKNHQVVIKKQSKLLSLKEKYVAI